MPARWEWTNPDLLVEIADSAARMIAAEVLSYATAVAPQATGNLARSITSAKTAHTATTCTYQVGTDVFYAPFVEFGTRYSPVPPGRVRHGGQRPFLGPALERARGMFT